MQLLDATRAYEAQIGPPATRRVQRTHVLHTAAKAFWLILWPEIRTEHVTVGKFFGFNIRIAIARLEPVFVRVFGPPPMPEAP